MKHNCGQETRFLLNRAAAVLSLLGFIIQVCVPRGPKDICLVVMPHGSIMSYIIGQYTPWLARICARSEHPQLLFFTGMSVPGQLHPNVARACKLLFVLLLLCIYKKSHKAMSFVNHSIQVKALDYRFVKKSGCLY